MSIHRRNVPESSFDGSQKDELDIRNDSGMKALISFFEKHCQYEPPQPRVAMQLVVILTRGRLTEVQLPRIFMDRASLEQLRTIACVEFPQASVHAESSANLSCTFQLLGISHFSVKYCYLAVLPIGCK